MLGAFFAICAAATFGFNTATVRRGVLTGSVLQAIAITVPLGVPLFVVAALAAGQLGAIGQFGWAGTGYLALAGILHFVWGRYWNYRAVREMGANLSGPVQQVSLLAALAFAVILLDEKLTVLRVIGIALVVLGPLVMARRSPRSRGGAGENTKAFQPNMLAGCMAAFMAALGYGLSPTLVRAGLADTGLAMAGGLISYVSATMAFLLVLLLPGRCAHVLRVDRAAAKWFTISGLFVFVAQMFRYLALAIAPVTVVAPILRLSLVFRVGLSTVLSREHEVFDARVVIGVAVSLLGALALTLSIDFVAELVALPQWVITWRWP